MNKNWNDDSKNINSSDDVLPKLETHDKSPIYLAGTCTSLK